MKPSALLEFALPTLAVLLLAAAPVVARAQAQAETVSRCGPLQNAYGPYDYRRDRDKLTVVETFHFGPLTENLIKPHGAHFGGDFDYTLRASPNHHRALITLAKYAERVKLPPHEIMYTAQYSVECYFDRAMRFAPDDMIVRMIYAGHLGRTNRAPEAIKQLDYVSTRAGDNPFTHYNLGLIYLEVKEYDKALAHAQEAQRQGLTRTELRDALKAAGKWSEPAASAAPSAAAPASSAASRP